MTPVNLPPGIWRNGTEYQAAGRWWDANLVRWVQGVARPMGGWTKRTASTFTGKARGILAWRDNSGDRQIVVGTSSKLYAIAEDATITDITPAVFTTGLDSAGTLTGYGTGLYGKGTWGTPRTEGTSVSLPATWQMDTWGETWVGVHSADKKVLTWDLNVANDAVAVTNAPTAAAVVVTAERILMALGADGNPRKIQWSDQEANTVWTPSATNRAGAWNLQTHGNLMCGLRVRAGVLLLTNVDVHLAGYVGMPYVYGFDRIGDGGVISPCAGTTIDGVAIWMGLDSFYQFDGSLAKLACEVQDYVFSDINRDQIGKVYAFTNNASNSEVWWLYPGQGSGEIDRYVAYNRLEKHWTIGRISRTCGVDRGPYTTPLMVGTDGYLYNHETGLSYDGAEIYLESGPFEIGNGEQMMDVYRMIPDEKTQGDCTVTFKLRNYPNAAERSTRAYTLGNPTSMRFQARQARMRVQSSRLADWRWGTPRLDVQPSGNER